MGGEACLRVRGSDPFEDPKVVKIPQDIAESLGLRDGDIVEIRVGNRATVAKVKVSRWL